MKKNKKITRQKKLIFWTSYLLTAHWKDQKLSKRKKEVGSMDVSVSFLEKKIEM